MFLNKYIIISIHEYKLINKKYLQLQNRVKVKSIICIIIINFSNVHFHQNSICLCLKKKYKINSDFKI